MHLALSEPVQLLAARLIGEVGIRVMGLATSHDEQGNIERSQPAISSSCKYGSILNTQA
jgi:hypothetical protein